MSEFSTTNFGSYKSASIDYNNDNRLDNLYNNITFGTYTPTFSGQVNVTAVSGFVAKYTKVGNIVTVMGRLELAPTTGTVGGTDTQLTISLPITSDLVNVYDVNGNHNCGTVSGVGGSVFAEPVTNQAVLRYLDKDGTHRFHSYVFSYIIN